MYDYDDESSFHEIVAGFYEDATRGWTPLSCLGLGLMLLLFWIIVIGGGMWLADHIHTSL